MRKNRKKKVSIYKIIPIIIFMVTILMGIGYASINSIIIGFDGEVIAKEVDGIYIAEVNYVSDVDADINKSKILNAYQTNLNSNIVLSDSNKDSSITYKIKILNTLKEDYIFNGVQYINDNYSNIGISYSLSGIKVGDVLDSGNNIIFTITFHYTDYVLADNNILESIINFDFIVKPRLIMTYDYSKQEETFVVPYDGIYKLEVWGAQGGSYSTIYHGGYGGYSVGYIYLQEGEKLFINVGGQGNFSSELSVGGYNGGGNSTKDKTEYTGSGGGATHIAKTSGLLASLSSYAKNDNSPILIVAGGGGGAAQDTSATYFGIGGSGGGISGGNGTSEKGSSYFGYGGTQTAGGTSTVTSGSFGRGGDASTELSNRGGGGGGGYYGGGSGVKFGGAGGGGSGYIANVNMFDKYMVCFECEPSNLEKTKTYSTDNISNIAQSDYPKAGDGYAKITFVGYDREIDYSGYEATYTAQKDGKYKLEVWGAQGGSYSTIYHGGYGGYSTGYVYLTKGSKLFVNVGGKGIFTPELSIGGYNGGGNSTKDKTEYTASGGGATHIATVSGLLSSLSSYAKNDDSPILIVAGGGGGAAQDESASYFGIGGSGGGIVGLDGTSEKSSEYFGYGGTQSAGGYSIVTSGSFGKGGDASSELNNRGGGGGGGYYGGGSGVKYGGAGGGGSGYIANVNLFDKYMVCFNCKESESVNTKTLSTQDVLEMPARDFVKIGNGYAKITFISEIEE